MAPVRSLNFEKANQNTKINAKPKPKFIANRNGLAEFSRYYIEIETTALDSGYKETRILNNGYMENAHWILG